MPWYPVSCVPNDRTWMKSSSIFRLGSTRKANDKLRAAACLSSSRGSALDAEHKSLSQREHRFPGAQTRGYPSSPPRSFPTMARPARRIESARAAKLSSST
jgi:hypothetical protein